MYDTDFQGTVGSLSDRVPSFLFSMYVYVPLVAEMQCPIFAFGHLTSRVEIKDVESLFSSFTSENISRPLKIIMLK